MADTSNFNFYAVIPDAEARQAVRAKVLDFAGSMTYTDEDDGRSIMVQANDVDVSMVEDCFAQILELIADGEPEWRCPVCKGEGKTEKVDPCLRCAGLCEYHLVVADFAFEVYSEPWDEWLGAIRMHGPGLRDFNGNCDANGEVLPNTSKILELVDAATDLDSLRRQLAVLTGRSHKAALTADQENT